MIKNDIGINAGVIWNLLSQNGKLTIRGIEEYTSYRDSMIHLALGWLARENKITFSVDNDNLYVELTNTYLEMYY
jgi:Protein of unknown function (DUF2582).